LVHPIRYKLAHTPSIWSGFNKKPARNTRDQKIFFAMWKMEIYRNFPNLLKHNTKENWATSSTFYYYIELK
jgi:hypothetical protein